MNKIVATTLEAKFHVYDLRTYHAKKGFSSLSEKVSFSLLFYMCHTVRLHQRAIPMHTRATYGQ